MTSLTPGAVVLVDGRASVQFAGDRALRVRLVSVSGEPTYPGWMWITGYVIGPKGTATTKRELYVQRAGLRVLAAPPPPAAAPTRLPTRPPAAPARLRPRDEMTRPASRVKRRDSATPSPHPTA